MRNCFSDTIKTVATDITCFSLLGTPLSNDFDIKSGAVYGAFTGILNRIVQPLVFEISGSSEQTSCSTGIVASLIVQYITEVGFATLLTSTTYKSVGIWDACKVTFLPFCLRTAIQHRNFGQIVTIDIKSPTSPGYGSRSFTLKATKDVELNDFLEGGTDQTNSFIEFEEEDSEDVLTLLSTLKDQPEYPTEGNYHVRPHSIYAV